MNEEQKLYIQQMQLWFKEQRRINKQIERAVTHHLEMAELNKKQLELDRKRISIVQKEYDTWLSSLDDQGDDKN